MSISAPPRLPWHADPDRLLRRFLERLLLTSVYVDLDARLRLEYEELKVCGNWTTCAYILYDLRDPRDRSPVWAARVKQNPANEDGVSLDDIIYALRGEGFDPLRAIFVRERTYAHVYRWGELPRLMRVEDLDRPVIIRMIP